MKKYFWMLMSCVAAVMGPVWADQTEPQGTISELQMRLNSKGIDELIGPVDYEFVYFKESSNAYPLADLKAFQEAKRIEHLPDGRVVINPPAGAPDSVTAESITFSATGVEEVPASLPSHGGDTTDNVGAVPGDPTKGRGAIQREPLTSTMPFVQDSSKTVGPRPPRVRFLGDKKGDPTSFDLSEVDVAALLKRPLPAYVEDITGVQLGVAIADPPGRELPALTQVEQEFTLAQRRVMRLDLREFYARIPTGVYLELGADQIEVKGDQAIANIHWHFTDQKEQQNTASLVLQNSPAGWQIKGAWEVIQKLAASR